MKRWMQKPSANVLFAQSLFVAPHGYSEHGVQGGTGTGTPALQYPM